MKDYRNLFWKNIAAIGGSLAVLLAPVVLKDTVGSARSHPESDSLEMIEPEINPADKTQNPELDRLATSQAQFGFQLFREIARQNGSDNTFISPLSVALVLSLLQNGADGTTQTEIASTLAADTFAEIATFNGANRALLQELNSIDTGNELEIANSLWIQQGFTVKPEFLDIGQQYYSADTINIDFGLPESVDRVNAWVADRTRGKIERILDANSISAATKLYAINTAYFKGRWKLQFNPDLTTAKPFFLDDDRTVEHPMMSNLGDYSYFEDADLQAITLPYEGDRLGMVIFLPSQESSLEEFLASLSVERFDALLAQMQVRKGRIEMPRFRQEYDVTLNPILQSLGLEAAFDPSQADFSRLSATALAVDTVQHKTFIEVNEEGTEAAAVTGTGLQITSIDIPFQMSVNRPFYFMLRDNETGAILFMGSIRNPSDS